MSSPLVLSDLDAANLSQSNDPSAILLMRVGLTDYQVAVSLIRNINIQALSLLPGVGNLATATDKFIISRIVSGTPQNFQIQFSQVGLLQGTKLWFYSLTPPVGWTLIANTGDRILAVSDGVNQYAGAAAGTQNGTWQQTQTVLTINQIPSHSHQMLCTVDAGSSIISMAKGRTENQIDTGPNRTAPTGGGLGHDHGNTWRPLANIGCLGVKST